MKTLLTILIATSVLYSQNEPVLLSDGAKVNIGYTTTFTNDTLLQFIDLLNTSALNSDNAYFKQHCYSMINVFQSKVLSEYEITFAKKMFVAFSDTNVAWSTGKLTSYLLRKRPFIISWTSPTDSVVSLAWLLLPENWTPDQQYPLYVTLHGLYGPYSDPIEYMSRYLTPDLVVDKSFENGYTLFPWGRGNIWYEGIGETDVWESIKSAENVIKVDTTRKYLMGHSMGGYGALGIGQKSAANWAALGIHAGALWYNNNKYLTQSAANNLKDIPVFFVCGTQDGLLGANQTAYQMLQDVGNPNIEFVTFPGGHEALLENWQKMYEWVKNFTNDRQNTKVGTDIAQIPLRTELFNNFPNPFNPTTTITYQLSVTSQVSLKVYDLLGREVKILTNGLIQAGKHSIIWNATSLPNGLYFYQLRTGNYSDTKKMIVLK